MQIKDSIIDYLKELQDINSTTLKSYSGEDPMKNREVSSEIQMIREIEAIKLRDRIHELSRYIAVIKRIQT